MEKINKIRKNKSESTIPTLTKDGIEFITSEEKANLFAEKLFGTFNEEETDEFDNVFKANVDKFISEKTYEKDYATNEVVLFNTKELNSAIKCLNNKKNIRLIWFK